jgi:hypothetical protein
MRKPTPIKRVLALVKTPLVQHMGGGVLAALAELAEDSPEEVRSVIASIPSIIGLVATGYSAWGDIVLDCWLVEEDSRPPQHALALCVCDHRL